MILKWPHLYYTLLNREHRTDEPSVNSLSTISLTTQTEKLLTRNSPEGFFYLISMLGNVVDNNVTAHQLGK